MDTNGIINLLGTISVHYPSIKKNILNEDGKVSKFVVNEWHRCIGFMEYEEAVEKLDAYLLQADGNRFAPTIADFLKKEPKRVQEFEPGNNKHKWFVDKHGHLYDEHGYEYGDPICSGNYYIDEQGRVCQIGQIIHQHGTFIEEGPDKWNFIGATA